MNVSTGVGASKPGAAPEGTAPVVQVSRPSADELVRAVRLDLEDVELRVQRVVRLRREAERATEDPVRDPDALDLAQDVTLGLDRAVTLDAGLLDRLQRDLGGPIARRAEGAH